MSADPEQEYFSDGISEELLDAFAKVGPLRVAARTSSFQFKSQSLDVRDVGRRPGVAAVLEGSVRKSGNRVRITAQLISAADGFHLWSDRYDRELDDVFQVQEEIAQSIVGALKVQLPRELEKLVHQGTRNPEAYATYLRGRHALERGSKAGLELAKELFEKAIAEDPGFAPLHSGLADAYLKFVNHDFLGEEEGLPLVRRSVERALELDDALAEAHISLSHLLREENDWEGAEREILKAIQESPSSVRAHGELGSLRTQQGRISEAVGLVRDAFALDPLSWAVSADLSYLYLLFADWERSRDQALRTIELAPNSGDGHGLLALALGELGQRKEALEQMETNIQLDPGYPGLQSDLAWIHAATGDRDSALDCLEKATAAGARPSERAQAWMRLGEAEEA